MDNIQEQKKISIDFLNNDRLFEIACIIDNEYRQYRDCRKYFDVRRSFQKINIRSTKCDWCSLISIIYDGKKVVTGINVLGEYTNGWQPIQAATMDRINKWYNQQSKQ